MGHYSDILDDKKLSIMMYIVDYYKSVGYSPTVREICNGVNLKSPSTVHAHLNKLEAHGYITKNTDTPRSIIVTDKYFNLYPDGDYNKKEDIYSSLKNVTTILTSEESITGENKDIYKLDAHKTEVLYTKLNNSFDCIKDEVLTGTQFGIAHKISIKIPVSSLMIYLDIPDDTNISVVESRLSSAMATINECSGKKISYGKIDHFDKNPSVEFFWHINSRKPSGVSIIF